MGISAEFEVITGWAGPGAVIAVGLWECAMEEGWERVVCVDGDGVDDCMVDGSC